jgi:hypothetical protein
VKLLVRFLVAIGLVALSGQAGRPVIAAPAPAGAGAITLQVIDASGTPLAGAAVRVYLLPFNAPNRFMPKLLAGGTADQGGVFSSTLDMAAVQDMLTSKHAAGTSFNAVVTAVVTAVDPAHHWRAETFRVLSTIAPTSMKIRASQNLSARRTLSRWSTQDLVTMGPVLSRAGCIVHECRPDVIRYPVVFANNSAGGTESNMTYTYSASSTRQTITSVTYSNDGLRWGIAGDSEETKQRTGSQGPIKEVGSYHWYWTAEYTFREYCNAPRGGCLSWWWSPLKWDGQIYASSHTHTPPPNRYARVFVGPYTRTTGQSHSFSDSFFCCVPGLQIANTSKAQYGDITVMMWQRNPATTCAAPRTIWIYGNNDYWNNSDEVYVNCTF